MGFSKNCFITEIFQRAIIGPPAKRLWMNYLKTVFVVLQNNSIYLSIFLYSRDHIWSFSEVSVF